MRTATMMLCALAVAAACLPSAAHEHATGVVKERMDVMEQMGRRMKSIRGRIERKRDLTAIKADAEAIAADASHILHLFPPGSMQQPTDARGAIWQSWPDFESKAKSLETESRKLAATNADEFAVLSAQVRAVTQACGSCHETYRVKRTGKSMR